MHKAVDAEFKNAGKQRGLEIWRVMVCKHSSLFPFYTHLG